MLKSLTIASVVAIVAFTGFAHAKQEKQVTRVIMELSDFPDLAAKAKAVCDGKASMSDKLKNACHTGQFPSVTKAGAFRNVGIGAELNTLIRQ
jgi:hypothetical protein